MQAENDELRAEIQAREDADELAEERVATSAPPPPARTKPATYSETAKRDPKPGQPQTKGVKNNPRKSNKKTLEKCREVKTASRLTIEVPSGVTMASAKAELWSKVKGKISNPRAKTVIKGTQIIIPDDGNTFEVISNLPKVRISEPRKPSHNIRRGLRSDGGRDYRWTKRPEP